MKFTQASVAHEQGKLLFCEYILNKSSGVAKVTGSSCSSPVWVCPFCILARDVPIFVGPMVLMLPPWQGLQYTPALRRGLILASGDWCACLVSSGCSYNPAVKQLALRMIGRASLLPFVLLLEACFKLVRAERVWNLWFSTCTLDLFCPVLISHRWVNFLPK